MRFQLYCTLNVCEQCEQKGVPYSYMQFLFSQLLVIYKGLLYIYIIILHRFTDTFITSLQLHRLYQRVLIIFYLFFEKNE